ncbi:transposase, partial [Sinorhizobium meliloti]|uniref:transposase n=1 Tax=Rhizobium meliloti TaxID=382 RepID=UPI000FE01B9C
MTRRRYELTDHEWSILSPLLPNKPRGVPRVDDRRVLNGILWRFRTGSPWAEIPERYVSAVSTPLDRLYFEAGWACEKVSRTIWRFAWQM